MSTRVCLAVTALRMRVIMSAIGSVISSLSKSQIPSPKSQVRTQPNPLRLGIWDSGFPVLPGALRHAGDIALERQLAEAEPAQIELAHVGAGPAAQVAAVPVANLVLERLGFLGDLRCRCHISLYPCGLRPTAF